MKYCFIDTETTGLDRITHNIFQISAIITDEKLKIQDQINLSFKPHDTKRIDPEALEKLCAGRKNELRRFDWEKAAGQTAEILNEALFRQ